MTSQNFTCTITAKTTARNAVNAINHVNLWWAKNYEGKSEKLNDVFTVRFGDTFVTFKLTEVVPNKKIMWLVTNCYLPWLNNKTEWTGTECVFDISTKNDLTTIHFTHIGLVPEVECYDACITGWTGHIKGSLLNLVTTGKGQPE